MQAHGRKPFRRANVFAQRLLQSLRPTNCVKQLEIRYTPVFMKFDNGVGVTKICQIVPVLGTVRQI